MTSLKVGDLVELRDGTGTVGTVLDVVESHPCLVLFPDTQKDNDQVIEHEGRALLLIDQEVFETLADTTIDVEDHADGPQFVVRR